MELVPRRTTPNWYRTTIPISTFTTLTTINPSSSINTTVTVFSTSSSLIGGPIPSISIPDPTTSKRITATTASAKPARTSAAAAKKKKKKALNGGGIAGIVAGVVGFLIAVMTGVWKWCCGGRRRKEKEKEKDEPGTRDLGVEEGKGGDEVKGNGMEEKSGEGVKVVEERGGERGVNLDEEVKKGGGEVMGTPDAEKREK